MSPPVAAEMARRLRTLPEPVVRTARLELVRPDRRHLDELVELLDDRSVARWTLHVPHPYRRSDALAYYARWRAGYRAGTSLPLQIVRREDGRLVGGTGLHYLSAEHRCAEVGYWIGAPYRGHGYAGEALRALTAVAFRRLALARLEGRVFPGNDASTAVLLGAGFRLEGRIRSAIVKNGRRRDDLVYGRLRGDPAPPVPAAEGRGTGAGPSGAPRK